MHSVEKYKITFQQLLEQVGQEVGISTWKVMSQARIDGFAELTEDRQFIHVDPVRAKAETSFNGTIAHGFLSLSLLSVFAAEALPQVTNVVMVLNYGFDKVRFLSPVPSGASLRGRFTLRDIAQTDRDRARASYQVSVEIRGVDRPALIADWLVMYELDSRS
jgi:acyl dehydratase